MVDLVQRKFECGKIDRGWVEYRRRQCLLRLHCRLRLDVSLTQSYLLLGRALLVGLSAVIGIVGRAGRSSLPLTKSLSIASHFKWSSAIVSQVLSLVRSLFCVVVSRRRGRLPISWPVFLDSNTPFAWLILLASSWRQLWSSGPRGVWQSSLPASSKSGSA